jgi:hypothetical protein
MWQSATITHMSSRYFGSRRPAKEHMTRGGGYAGEVRDLRKDTESAFLQVQSEVDPLQSDLSQAQDDVEQLQEDFEAHGSAGIYGLQSSWGVDEVAGNDNGVGTSVAPLRSVTELNRRLSYTSISQDTTIQLIGNVSTPLDLVNTQIAPGVSVTVSGTVTAITTGTISAVSALVGSGYPWQVDCTGINWTTVTDRLLVTNTGKTFWVSEVVSATRVILSAGANAAGTVQAPVNAETFTVQSLSTIPLSYLGTLGGFVSAGSIFGLTLQDLHFTGGNTHPAFAATTRAKLQRCQIDMPSNGGLSLNGQNWSLISCKIAGNGSHQVQATGILGFTACLFDSTAATFQFRTPVRCTQSSVVYNNTKLDIRNTLDVQGGGLHIRNVAGDCLTIGAGAILVAPTTTSLVSGASNSVGVGITVQSGAQYLYQTSSKPTLTAASDTKIGGVGLAYSSIPAITAANNAQMSVLV